jgi:hypothetical protein
MAAARTTSTIYHTSPHGLFERELWELNDSEYGIQINQTYCEEDESQWTESEDWMSYLQVRY